MEHTDSADLAWLHPAEILTGPEKDLADFFGVTVKTIRNWKKTGRAPLMALRLMRLRLDGDLSALGGSAWAHFRFGADGKLYMPGWRYGWEPGELRGLFFRVKAAQYWEREAKRLERELQMMREAAWAAEKVRKAVRPATATARGMLRR